MRMRESLIGWVCALFLGVHMHANQDDLARAGGNESVDERSQKFIAEQTVRLTESAKAIADPKLQPNPETAAWTTLCQALLRSNEFLYVD